MAMDPYKVLGIDKNATPEEIKKAYRKKAKENHPDLHPDDPDANQKMNEINEAYDMINNPEKYQQQAFNQNPYGNAGQTYGQQGYYQNGNQDFRYYSFEDLFGFNSGFGGYNAPAPEIYPEDSDTIRSVVQCINAQDFRNAIRYLNSVASYDRNARWYYLAALTSYYSGNRQQGVNLIQRAVNMEPTNSLYQEILNGFSTIPGGNAQNFNNAYQTRTRTINLSGIFWFFFLMMLLNSCAPLLFWGR